MKIKLLLIIFLAVIFTALPLKIFAAELKISSPVNNFGVGQEFLVNILLNTPDETINAVEGRVIFPTDLLKVKEIRSGDSIINLWADQPAIKNSGNVSFSGIVPGGYQDNNGLLFKIVFQAVKAGVGEVKLNQARALLNDGRGTTASLQIAPWLFSIDNATNSTTTTMAVEVIKDSEPPENFTPALARDPQIFDNQWFAVFAAVDKGSGIDHYEVCEGSLIDCRTATSPYLLTNQKLDQDVFVKAIDKNFHQRLATIKLAKPTLIKGYKNIWLYAIIILIGLSLIFIFLIKTVWRWRPRRKRY